MILMSGCCCSRDSGEAVRKINLSAILDQSGVACSLMVMSVPVFGSVFFFSFLYTLISICSLYFIISPLSVSSTTYLTVSPQPQ